MRLLLPLWCCQAQSMFPLLAELSASVRKRLEAFFCDTVMNHDNTDSNDDDGGCCGGGCCGCGCGCGGDGDGDDNNNNSNNERTNERTHARTNERASERASEHRAAISDNDNNNNNDSKNINDDNQWLKALYYTLLACLRPVVSNLYISKTSLQGSQTALVSKASTASMGLTARMMDGGGAPGFSRLWVPVGGRHLRHRCKIQSIVIPPYIKTLHDRQSDARMHRGCNMVSIWLQHVPQHGCNIGCDGTQLQHWFQHWNAGEYTVRYYVTWTFGGLYC